MRDLTLKQRQLKHLKVNHLKELVSAECQLITNKTEVTQMSANLLNSLNLVTLIERVHLSGSLKRLDHLIKSKSPRREAQQANNRIQASRRTSPYAPWRNSPNKI